LLIVDGHQSHITTAAIQFAIKHCIIILCLPPHTTHILQLLDVGVFGPLALAYKKGIANRTRFAASYSIDKVDFLEVWQQARCDTVTAEIVLKSWEKVGLFPFNPALVVNELPMSKRKAAASTIIRSVTPESGVFPHSLLWKFSIGDDIEIPLTPSNARECQVLIDKLPVAGVTLDPLDLERIQKLSKGASFAFANAFIQSSTNTELLSVIAQKKERANRLNENYGLGRVMNAEVLYEREVGRKQEYFELVWLHFLKWDPNLYGTLLKFKEPLKLSGKGNERSFAAVMKLWAEYPHYDVFSIEIEVTQFTEVASRSPIPAKSKRKAKNAVALPIVEVVEETVHTRAGRQVYKKRHFGS